jgi:hypothetical protein
MSTTGVLSIYLIYYLSTIYLSIYLSIYLYPYIYTHIIHIYTHNILGAKRWSSEESADVCVCVLGAKRWSSEESADDDEERYSNDLLYYSHYLLY